MKLFKNHMKRVEKVKDYASKNKVFVITAIVAAIFLFINFVIQPQNQQNQQSDNDEVIISDNAESEGETTAQAARTTTIERESWRFYFIDLIVLGVGGGFCLIMILRQRRKTKEELK
jgi:preprotein translocase subunit YajC